MMKVKVTLSSEKEEIQGLNLPVTAKRIEKCPIPITIGHKVVVNELKDKEGDLKEPMPFMVHDVLIDVNSVEILLGDPVDLYVQIPSEPVSEEAMKALMKSFDELKNEIAKSNV